MILQFFITEANEGNVYVVGCEETREAVLIDAGAFDDRVVEFVRERGLTVKAILLTHMHYDHTGGVDGYEREFGCGAVNAGALAEGQTFEFGRLSLRALSTSGHTPDSTTYVLDSEGVAFTGDALFAGSIGGTAGPREQAEEIANIRQKIFTLPDETVLFTGHGPATTVGAEKAHNPFFDA
jgi:hydroxyacylglutathione hydrolase